MMILCCVKKNNLNLQKKDKVCRILPIDLAFQTTERYPETTGTMELCEKSGPHTCLLEGTEKKTFKSGPFNTFHHLQRYDYAEKSVPSSSVKDRSQLHPLAEGSIRKKKTTSSHPYTSFLITDLSDGWWFPLHPQPSETRKSHHVSDEESCLYGGLGKFLTLTKAQSKMNHLMQGRNTFGQRSHPWPFL